MKRLFALLLAFSLLLCACGNDEPQQTTAEPATLPTETTEAPTEAPTVPTTEATEPVNLTHPLTGEQLDAPFTGRPVASTLNNMVSAMPQYGISQADWVFEVETEGGITRCLGIFTDPEDIGTIGPVRSARTYFISLSASFGAPLAHCGGSTLATAAYYSRDDILQDYRDIDEMHYPSYFFRDSDRLSQGYSYEHTLFTTGEKLKQAMEDKGYNDVVNENGVDYGMQFDKSAALNGDAADEVIIRFWGGKKTTMVYNKNSDCYEASQYGGDWIDATTGEVLSFKNILVIYAEQSKEIAPNSLYTLQGEGEGYLALGGKIVPIKWSRADVHDPFSYTLENGKPVTLGVGTTYAAVVSPNGSVTFG